VTLSATAPRPASSGARTRRRARANAEPVSYDFRRPIQLSREHSRILQVGLTGFARQASTVFTSSLRTVCSVQLLSIAQESYSEYVDSRHAPTYLVKFTAEPMPGLGVLEIPLPALMNSIDLMLGGPGSAQQPVRPLTDIESGVVRGVVERLLGELDYSLAGIVEIATSLAGIEYSPQFVQAAGAADVMIVATFDLRIGERVHKMTICLPFSGLQPHLAKAAAPAPVSERERAQRAHAAAMVDRQFQEVPVSVSVRFRSTRLGPDLLGDLAVGDVLRLAHPASTPLDVTVDETTFAHATPGTHGARLAALIVGTPKETA
jgi:flagellar motor switch protein FliM